MKVAMLSLVDASNGLGVMINVNNIIAIREQPTGECVIELSSVDKLDGNTIVTVTSTYTELGEMIYEINQSA